MTCQKARTGLCLTVMEECSCLKWKQTNVPNRRWPHRAASLRPHDTQYLAEVAAEVNACLPSKYRLASRLRVFCIGPGDFPGHDSVLRGTHGTARDGDDHDGKNRRPARISLPAGFHGFWPQSPKDVNSYFCKSAPDHFSGEKLGLIVKKPFLAVAPGKPQEAP